MCFHKSFYRCQAWVQGGTTPIKSAPSGTARAEESRREVKGSEWVLSCLKDDILCAHFVTWKIFNFVNQKYKSSPSISPLNITRSTNMPQKIHRCIKIASIIRVYLHFPPPFYISSNEKTKQENCNMGEDTKSKGASRVCKPCKWWQKSALKYKLGQYL